MLNLSLLVDWIKRSLQKFLRVLQDLEWWYTVTLPFMAFLYLWIIDFILTIIKYSNYSVLVLLCRASQLFHGGAGLVLVLLSRCHLVATGWSLSNATSTAVKPWSTQSSDPLACNILNTSYTSTYTKQRMTLTYQSYQSAMHWFKIKTAEKNAVFQTDQRGDCECG